MEVVQDNPIFKSIGLLDWIYGEYILILVIAILAPVWMVTRVRRQLPPGPWRIPLVGHLPLLGNEPYRFFDKLRAKYGSVFSMYIGREFVVVLGDFPAIQEAYSKEEFLGRPLHPPNLLVPNTTSFSTRSGDTWREHRRFALQSLRDLGFAKSISEGEMQKEISCFLHEIGQSKGTPFDIKRVLSSSISNNITSMMIGRRMDYHDPARRNLDNALDILAKFFKPTSVHAYFPWTKKILMSLRIWGYGQLKDAVKEIIEFLKVEMELHQKTLDTSRPRDYVDKFLIEMKDRGLHVNDSFTVEMLKGNVVSLLTAGTEPVIATVDWVLATMATFPDVQRRVQKEIDEVVGRDTLPSWDHHTRMPYTQACIMEVQRWKTVVPINMLRRTQGETTIQGYSIPKESLVISNLWAVHHDATYWENPEEYCPERFLNDGGTEIKKFDYFIPFSYGKRNCPGLSLGKMEVFLYITSVLQRYSLQLPEGADPTENKDLGIALMVRPYKLRFVPRL